METENIIQDNLQEDISESDLAYFDRLNLFQQEIEAQKRGFIVRELVYSKLELQNSILEIDKALFDYAVGDC